LNNLLPRVGGFWTSAADSGVFGVGLNVTAADSTNAHGARAVRLLSA